MGWHYSIHNINDSLSNTYEEDDMEEPCRGIHQCLLHPLCRRHTHQELGRVQVIGRISHAKPIADPA